MKNNAAFVFPGQGSQKMGMLADFAKQFSLVKNLFDEASAILNYDLWQLISEGPEEKLNKTIYTQPAVFVADMAVWQVWRAQNGFLPQFVAGHSLGEYAALVAAESIQFADALSLISQRAQLMQKAVPENEGSMAAIIGLNQAQVADICLKASNEGLVQPANYNSPQQIVIAGQTVAVSKAMQLAKEYGARLVKKLAVSVPSHCGLMEPAAYKLGRYLEKIKIKKPKIPVVHNLDATIRPEPDAIREALKKQLYHTVKWTETIAYLMWHDIKTIAECGPGKILTGLNRATNANLKLVILSDCEAMSSFLKASGEK